MNTALFAYTTAERWVRVSDWVSQPEADALYAKVEDLIRDGNHVTVEVKHPTTRSAGYTAEVKHFALRPQMHNWPSEMVAKENGVRCWSPRAYVSDIAAVKAWNRTLHSRYHGTAGGWIYEGTRRVCQGWTKVPGVRLMRTEGGQYRFLYKSVSTKVEVAA